MLNLIKLAQVSLSMGISMTYYYLPAEGFHLSWTNNIASTYLIMLCFEKNVTLLYYLWKCKWYKTINFKNLSRYSQQHIRLYTGILYRP
jgi:hypothetical protein